MTIEDHMQAIANIIAEREGAKHGAPVVRYALALEVMLHEHPRPSVFTEISDNMTAWSLKGLAWLLNKECERIYRFIAGEDD